MSVKLANLAKLDRYELDYSKRTGTRVLESKSYEKAFEHLSETTKLGNKAA